MKKTLLMTCALLALSAGLAFASAGGLNLGWGDCGGLTPNRSFACNTNSGTNSMVGSFVAPCCVTACSANEIVVDLQAATPSLPDWWRFGSGQCRPSSLSASAAFNSAGLFACLDYWQDQATAAPPNYTIGVGGANRARIKGLVALPSGSSQIGPIADGTETYSFKFNVSNTKTAGLGACGGCLTGVAIVLNSIKINQPVGTPGGDKFVSGMNVNNCAVWQSAAPGCGVTPARNETWGSVKALYR